MCVSKFDYNPDGTITTLPWWDNAGVAQLGTLDPYVRSEAETMAWSEGIKSEPSSAGGLNVYANRGDAYIKVEGVNFGTDGAGTFTASVACDTKTGSKGGALELHLDSQTGPFLGTLPVSIAAASGKSIRFPSQARPALTTSTSFSRAKPPARFSKSITGNLGKKTAAR